MAESEQAQQAAATGPENANDLRGFHFRRLIGKPLTWALIGGLALLAGILGAALIGPAIGGIAFVLVLLAGIAIVFAIADRRAADSFFAAYAEERGLVLEGRSSLPPATPLLRKGDDRYAKRTLTGQLGSGIGGILALYTYEEKHNDGNSGQETSYCNYTVGIAEVPECATHVPELYCQRKFGFRALEKFEDVFRRSKERVKLESEALDDKYEIFAGKDQDANWLRQLFSPTFIVWLTDEAPKKFAFELVDGTLCCYVSGHKEDAEHLDSVAAATGAVARRLADEAAESSAAPEAPPAREPSG